MKDIEAMVQDCRERAATGEQLALATVVQVEGSAYRRPGARMLIGAQGRRIGTISGGCLEGDVIAHAQQVMQTGKPAYVLYDPRRENGDVIIESGCKGAVGIWIERVDSEVLSALDFLASFSHSHKRGQGALATVFRTEGNAPLQPGDFLTLRGSEWTLPPHADADLLATLWEDLEIAMQTGKTQTKTYAFADGSVDALIEAVQSPVALLLCGSGPDAEPLAQMARLLGWQVTIADPNPEGLIAERFPGVESLLPVGPERLSNHITLDARTVAVVMTHNYARDQAWLETLLASPVAYIGLLGPRRRAERLCQDIAASSGLAPTAELPTRLHSPTGLDIGSETPEEIALAVIAEIQAVLNQREGGFLRNRRTPIHATADYTAVRLPASHPVNSCPVSAS